MSIPSLTAPFPRVWAGPALLGSDHRPTGAESGVDGVAGRGPDAFRLWLGVREGPARPIRYPAESRRIMVGIDFSWASDQALSLVAGIAAATETCVDLVHVFDGFSEAFVRGDRSILDRVDTVLAGVARALRLRTLATSAQGVRCVSTSLVGAPGIELTQHARKTGADLLVLGIGLARGGPFGPAWSGDGVAQVLRSGAWRALGR